MTPALALVPLAFGPIYLTFAAVGIGIALIAALGRRPGAERSEQAAETDKRGQASGPEIDLLEASVERKAEFLIRMGFNEIDWIADEPTPGVTAFAARNPMPMSGGNYLIHFLKRQKDPVDSARVNQFRKHVKGEEKVLKGILITSGAFTTEGWQVAESAPIELVDGKHLVGLLKMFFPDKFPKDRI
jgi:hypothetical protein